MSERVLVDRFGLKSCAFCLTRLNNLSSEALYSDSYIIRITNYCLSLCRSQRQHFINDQKRVLDTKVADLLYMGKPAPLQIQLGDPSPHLFQLGVTAPT